MNRQEAAANLYRKLGWSPGFTGRLVWLRAGRMVDALEVPRPLGERALQLLPTTGPLFEAPEGPRPQWVFLTEPACRMTELLPTLGVDHITAGRTVDLPPSQFGPHRLRWLTPPTLPLPPFVTVAEAIIQAAR